MRTLLPTLLAALALAAPGRAGELAVLTNANWDRLAPDGKEADCILGDFAFRSDRLQAVVGRPLPTRNANMTVRQVGGALIDLTLTDRPNDQLSAFYPGKRLFVYNKAEIKVAKGKRVVLTVHADAQPARDKTPALPKVDLEYALEDGRAYLEVRSVFTNTHAEAVTVPLEDDLRLDDVETRVKAGPTDLFWSHDRHFEQAYGVIADKHDLLTRSDLRTSLLSYAHPKSGEAEVTLKPGEKYELVRRVFPGRHLLAVKGEVARFRNQPLVKQGFHIVDGKFKPVAGAEIQLKQGENVYGSGRTDAWGWVKADVPPGKYTLTYKAVGHGSREQELARIAHRVMATRASRTI